MLSVKDYQIIRGLPAEVESRLKQAIKDGWQPHGLLMQFHQDGTEILIQAMVKYETDNSCFDQFRLSSQIGEQ